MEILRELCLRLPDSELTLVSLSLFSWRMALAQMKIKIPMPMVKGPSIFILSEWRCCSKNLARAPPVCLEGVAGSRTCSALALFFFWWLVRGDTEEEEWLTLDVVECASVSRCGASRCGVSCGAVARIGSAASSSLGRMHGFTLRPVAQGGHPDSYGQDDQTQEQEEARSGVEAEPATHDHNIRAPFPFSEKLMYSMNSRF